MAVSFVGSEVITVVPTAWRFSENLVAPYGIITVPSRTDTFVHDNPVCG